MRLYACILCSRMYILKLVISRYYTFRKSRDSSVDIALGCGLVLGFDFRRVLGTFLFTTASRTALGSTQPPIQWVPVALSLGVKRPEREADNSPPSSAGVKNAWSYTSTPQYAFMAWCSVKAQGQLYLYLLLLIYFEPG
jgi:hypothetical protein